MLVRAQKKRAARERDRLARGKKGRDFKTQDGKLLVTLSYVRVPSRKYSLIYYDAEPFHMHPTCGDSL